MLVLLLPLGDLSLDTQKLMHRLAANHIHGLFKVFALKLIHCQELVNKALTHVEANLLQLLVNYFRFIVGGFFKKFGNVDSVGNLKKLDLSLRGFSKHSLVDLGDG